MICRNCGWTNPEGRAHCEKCGQALVYSVRRAVPGKAPGDNECQDCGYPVSSLSTVCPNCGKVLKQAQPAVAPVPVRATVMAQVPEEPAKAPRAATVLDASAFSRLAETRADDVSAKSAPQPVTGNHTVRDVAAALLDAAGDTFRLVSVNDHPLKTIVLRLGEAVEIEGKRFFFTK